MTVRILLAPDKFKGTMTSAQAIDIMRRAIRLNDPAAEVTSVVMADGGDGTLAAAADRGFVLRKGPTVDALGRPTVGSFARRGDMALVELASVCGLATVLDQPLRPLQASTLGLGMLAKQAVVDGAREVLVALGGSASVDGGLGFLMGLGFAVADGAGRRVTPDLAGLGRAVRFDHETASVSVHECRWRFLVDVDNPLLGPDGAAATFGPQKGLSPTQIVEAEHSLATWAALLGTADPELSARPGMGAAGGVAFAGAAVLDATVESGAAWVANLGGLTRAMAEVDVVVTGEGAFDRQSLAGKGPMEVIDRAVALGKEVYVIAGTVDVPAAELTRHGVSGAVSLVDVAGSLSAATANPSLWLATAVQRLLDDRRTRGR
jgi:glycerate 2-kinase